MTWWGARGQLVLLVMKQLLSEWGTPDEFPHRLRWIPRKASVQNAKCGENLRVADCRKKVIASHCRSATAPPMKVLQHYHQVMELRRFWEAPQRDQKSWHGVGRGTAASSFPQKMDPGGTGGLRRMARQWNPCPPNSSLRTRLSSLSLCIWKFTPEWRVVQVRESLWGQFTNLSPLFSLCRKKAFSNRNFKGAITLWALQKKLYIYIWSNLSNICLR